jgi:anti-anti-sigma factor
MAVERGPGWVFVALHSPPRSDSASWSDPHAPSLAEDIWQILQQHMVDRLVLQMNGVDFINSQLLGQLVLLHKRIHNSGGIVRLCGLSAANEQVLHVAGVDSRFPHYDNLDDAIRGTTVRPR